MQRTLNDFWIDGSAIHLDHIVKIVDIVDAIGALRAEFTAF